MFSSWLCVIKLVLTLLVYVVATTDANAHIVLIVRRVGVS